MLCLRESVSRSGKNGILEEGLGGATFGTTTRSPRMQSHNCTHPSPDQTPTDALRESNWLPVIHASIYIPSLKASKDIPFLESPTFIGLIWNLTNHTVSLTESKQQKYLGAISEWECRRTHMLQDVQKLHGKLLHASLIFPHGHAYLTNLEAMLSIFGDEPFKPRMPPRGTPEDLRWW